MSLAIREIEIKATVQLEPPWFPSTFVESIALFHELWGLRIHSGGVGAGLRLYMCFNPKGWWGKEKERSQASVGLTYAHVSQVS